MRLEIAVRDDIHDSRMLKKLKNVAIGIGAVIALLALVAVGGGLLLDDTMTLETSQPLTAAA